LTQCSVPGVEPALEPELAAVAVGYARLVAAAVEDVAAD